MKNYNFILNPFLYLSKSSSRRLLTFHLMLAIIGFISNVFIILWFYFLIFSFLALSRHQKQVILPILLAYLVPLEIYLRLQNCTPFVPVEGIKYLSVFLLCYGIVTNLNKSNIIGWLLILLSIPSFFIIPLEYYSLRVYLISSYLGFLVMALFVLYFSKLYLTHSFLINLFKIILFGSILILFHIVFSSSFDTLDFKLQANSKFTGGFGTNQVGSILGVGLVILILDSLFKLKIFSSRIFSFVLIALFVIMSFLSFSRGGMISPVISLLFCAFKFYKNISFRFLKRFAFGFTLFFSIFFVLNNLTNNKLYLRFSGETESTVLGLREKNLNSITSGRFDLLKSDIQMFLENPIFGVGPGQSTPSRENYAIGRAIVPHIQLSTLVAEHGFFGLIMVFIITIHFLVFLLRKVDSIYNLLLLFSICLAISYTFHSATRTIIPAFFYGISFVHLKLKSQNSK